MSSSSAPQLQWEKKNQNLLRTPSNATIAKRPIPHAPIASPYAGPAAPKQVYVSSKSPFMSVVKRVQKLLLLAEKRRDNSSRHGPQSRSRSRSGNAGASTSAVQRQNMSAQTRTTNANATDAQTAGGQATTGTTETESSVEPVFVKATGRAMERALAVGRWFEQRDGEYQVAVKTGSVLVVDDIVETEEREHGEKEEEEDDEDAQRRRRSSSSKKNKKKRKQQQALAVDEDGDVLESRTRFVNSVEVRVALRC